MDMVIWVFKLSGRLIMGKFLNLWIIIKINLAEPFRWRIVALYTQSKILIIRVYITAKYNKGY